MTAREAVDYADSVLTPLLMDRRQTPRLFPEDAELVLSRGREEGPDVAAIATSNRTVVPPIEVRPTDSDYLAELERVTAEEQRLQEDRERLEAMFQEGAAKLQAARQEEATAEWTRVQALALDGSVTGQRAVEAFLRKWKGRTEPLDGRVVAIEVAEVAVAEGVLTKLKGSAKKRNGGARDWTGPVSGYAMVAIPAGRLTMGCTRDAGHCEDDEKPAHEVVLTRSFLTGETEVTQGLWEQVTGESPSEFASCGSTCPAENVSWFDAVAFANALSRRDGLEECYAISGRAVAWPRGLDCQGYRLPTEAEWEYAARAGRDAKYAGENRVGAVAWTRKNSRDETHPVAQKASNDWGLFDMSGNVWEWVWDWRGEYPSGATDPLGPSSGYYRVTRGGGVNSGPRNVRVAKRGGLGPDLRTRVIGVRLVRSAP